MPARSLRIPTHCSWGTQNEIALEVAALCDLAARLATLAAESNPLQSSPSVLAALRLAGEFAGLSRNQSFVVAIFRSAENAFIGDIDPLSIILAMARILPGTSICSVVSEPSIVYAMCSPPSGVSNRLYRPACLGTGGVGVLILESFRLVECPRLTTVHRIYRCVSSGSF